VSSVVGEPTLELTEDGEVRGDTGCNTFSGSYELDGGTLEFGPLATTRMTCDGVEGAQEEHVLQVLEAAPWRPRSTVRTCDCVPTSGRWSTGPTEAGRIGRGPIRVPTGQAPRHDRLRRRTVQLLPPGRATSGHTATA
jgi:hypothetical protein